MKIKKLSVTNFRNYSKQDVAFGDGLNFLLGKNAQGKTNLLEAIYVSSLGHSPRGVKDKDLMTWGADLSNIRLEIEKKAGSIFLETKLYKTNKKVITIDSIPILRIGELLGYLNTVYFSPDELSLIKDAPGERRRFLDINISQIKKSYFYLLTRYNKILTQRNRLLKQLQASDKNKDTLSIWDTQLAKEGEQVTLTRQKFVENLSPFIEKTHSYLTSKEEAITIAYENAFTDNNLEINYKTFYGQLQSSHERDIKLGHTGIGPHRDDIKITINGFDVRGFGSQGQQRTCTLSLKLGLAKMYESLLGEPPVLLLDDVFSELDSKRQHRLLKLLQNTQTIITGVDSLQETVKQHGGKIFIIENGIIK